MPAWLYILRLKSGALYPGVTCDLSTRIGAHFAGRACRTTILDPPLELVYSEEFTTLGQARKREWQIKHWTRAKKESLIRADLQSLKVLAQRRKQ